ncbi:glycosyltransferase family 2 protein [Spirosoma fluviale]|uniref:Glycosyltransferase, GT2 family n=1 Tax=Spirosoma fluviale TaxID=1597977 RepID=A0A286GS06_9BACT|nr:glycosyltransferase family 2 protein [Spirosoma fluviale]SOD98308.1 Glycosyltransferase, GT2 family [Spirosoma fluviale]
MKTIAVLLTCHNRKTFTLNCLDALYKCQLPDNIAIQVFLVDDGCTDGTSEAVHEAYEKVNVIQGTGSLYWNRGMHLAWATARVAHDFDYYLWLNDDTLLSNEGIIELLSVESYANEAVLVCGAVNSSKTGEFTYGGRSLSDAEVVPNGQLQYCAKINGNVVLVSKQISNAIGLLDPIFPHAIGDYDYGLRAMTYGYKIITTRKYIGVCERNCSLPKWCYSKIPFIKRVKALYSPLGNSHPKYFFIFENRHYGLSIALKHFLSIHLRVLFPWLWKF